jgi:hypothetical protein
MTTLARVCLHMCHRALCRDAGARLRLLQGHRYTARSDALRYSPGMGLLFRTLLIWLLVLTVPAQGVAAATMAFCGPDHHGGEAAAVRLIAGSSADLVAAQGQGHVHAQAADGATARHAHHDHHAMGSSAGGDGDGADGQAPALADHGASHDSSAHKCSACASCCSVGAILNSVLDVPAPALVPTVFSAVVPVVVAFAADGPDRPPRRVLA